MGETGVSFLFDGMNYLGGFNGMESVVINTTELKNAAEEIPDCDDFLNKGLSISIPIKVKYSKAFKEMLRKDKVQRELMERRIKRLNRRIHRKLVLLKISGYHLEYDETGIYAVKDR